MCMQFSTSVVSHIYTLALLYCMLSHGFNGNYWIAKEGGTVSIYVLYMYCGNTMVCYAWYICYRCQLGFYKFQRQASSPE